MHLLKIILVIAENCWQLQPHHLSSCHVASNPSLLEASLEMSWPQYQSATRRIGGDLFLEIQPSEYPACSLEGSRALQGQPGLVQAPPRASGSSGKVRMCWRSNNKIKMPSVVAPAWKHGGSIMVPANDHSNKSQGGRGSLLLSPLSVQPSLLLHLIRGETISQSPSDAQTLPSALRHCTLQS